MIQLFPACAGMNRRDHSTGPTFPAVPRVRGDEPPGAFSGETDGSCSPRARG